jgi:hypothetical protein
MNKQLEIGALHGWRGLEISKPLTRTGEYDSLMAYKLTRSSQLYNLFLFDL